MRETAGPPLPVCAHVLVPLPHYAVLSRPLHTHAQPAADCFLLRCIQARNQLAVVRGSEYSMIKARFDELHERQARVLDTLGGDAWSARLRAAADAAEATSSAAVDDFLAGKLPLEAFLESHLASRTRSHALDLKRQAAEPLFSALQGSGGGSVHAT